MHFLIHSCGKWPAEEYTQHVNSSLKNQSLHSNVRYKRRRDPKSVTVPVHAGNVAPKVTCSVCRTDLDCVNKHRITLKSKAKYIRNEYSPSGDVDSYQMLKPYLKEPANVRLVVGTHENHVLKQPEKRPVVSFFWPQHG